MRLDLPLLAVALACSAPLAAQSAPADNPDLPGVEYALLELAAAPEAAPPSPQYGPFWDRRGLLASQIEAANTANGGAAAPPLAAGWIDFTTYVRIEPDRVIYFNPLPGPTSGQQATHVCRISVDLAGAGILGPDSLQALDVKRCAAPPAWVLARLADRYRQRGRGRMTARTVMTAPDGETVFVEHRGGGIDNADNPVAPDDRTNGVRAYYQLPTRDSLVASAFQRAWVLERADGTFDLAVRFELLENGSHSGCLLRDARGSFPSESWITRDLWRWCREQDSRFKASLPPEQRRN